MCVASAKSYEASTENDHRVVEKGSAVRNARLAFAEWPHFNDCFFVPWTNQYRVVVDDRVRNSAAEPETIGRDITGAKLRGIPFRGAVQP
jgi:hypothetical protein